MDATVPAPARAALAERAVLSRYLHRFGPVAWAHASPGSRTWHYWWHAHLVHVLADTERRAPDRRRRAVLAAVVRGVGLRTGLTWITPYYDDIAWMGLALDAAGGHRWPRRRIARRLARAVDPRTGVLPWRVGSTLFNAPANAPGGLVLVAHGRRDAAERFAEWMASVLHDDDTGLVRDGREDGRVRPDLWTYNQGAVIGLELALSDENPLGAAHEDRARALVRAVDAWCAPQDGLFPAAGGGDGGLFAGILARYLAEAAVRVSGPEGATARRLVERNADAIWATAVDGLFSADPRRPARPEGDDLDLSVQLGAWITLEAAAAIAPRP
ncbi:glycoside hydrolase family 76 protein [Microbacterium sp. LMI1-1-1.1]|uniref:glycoside hydrolase family 76 protein n=1 Tax=Microbacterium sp. LMI1-1-1.1 TaxID=3135223 RepID=UPI00346762C7